MKRDITLYTQDYQSSGGKLIVAVNENGEVTHLTLPNGHEHWAREIAKYHYNIVPNSAHCDAAIAQLDEYFQQKRTTFDLPLKPEGTEFQLEVWSALRGIPYGKTISYKELAERIGNPAAVRAVGRANGTNPIPIIVPCHRVIGSDGSLTGFGGGLPLKEFLLKLEGVPLGQPDSVPEAQLSLL